MIWTHLEICACQAHEKKEVRLGLHIFARNTKMHVHMQLFMCVKANIHDSVMHSQARHVEADHMYTHIFLNFRI